MRQYYRDLKVNLWFVAIAILLLASGLCFALPGYNGHIFRLINTIALFAVLLLMALFDYKLCIIPNHLVVISIVLSTVFILLEGIGNPHILSKLWFYYFVMGSSCALFFALGWLLNFGIGAGDVKMYFAIGYAVGFPVAIYAVFYSLLAALCCGLVLLFSKGASKAKLPLAPFALIGFVAALFFQF